MDKKNHWEGIYQTKKVDEVSWYQLRSEQTLRLIDSAKLDPKARIIDVGGGTSSLVDCLLERGYKNLSVLDVSEKALTTVKERLDRKTEVVEWIISDILDFQPHKKFDFWHDRAVFHFLTNPKEREKYLEVMSGALNIDAYVLISTFGPEGPEKCSGLPVQRYDSDSIQHTLGSGYQLLSTEQEIHLTPWGSHQQFVHCLFKRVTPHTI